MTDKLKDGGPATGAFVVVQECAAGNGCVGEMWLETEIFNPQTTLEQVWEWSKGNANGNRIILTLPTSSKPAEDIPF